MSLDIYDREILRFLLKRFPTATTTNAIANELKISWNTTLTHLTRLHKEEYVTKTATAYIKGGNKIIFWKINR